MTHFEITPAELGYKGYPWSLFKYYKDRGYVLTYAGSRWSQPADDNSIIIPIPNDPNSILIKIKK
jgi:hypothetical protein